MSVIALCNEDDALLFAPVRDHKRLCNGDKGPNTGGMGVVGPLPQAQDAAFMSMLKEKFFLPTLSYMRKAGCPFRGALFAGLMVDGPDVKLLEFNARFGDPETQALMFGCQIDLFPMLLAVAKGERLAEYGENDLVKMTPTAAITMATRGYPESPQGGDKITMPEISPDQGKVFFAGIARHSSGYLVSQPGRVLTATAKAESLRMAIHKSYDIVSHISFFGAQYRADIGRTLL
jgi:phosphoribosylamine--glycine ligase